MALEIPSSDLDFARQVDEMGRSGMKQEHIAKTFGLSRGQLRYRLNQSGFDWRMEVRVKFAPTGENVVDLVQAKKLRPQEVAG